MPHYRKAALISAAFLLLGSILLGCSVQPWLSPQEKAVAIAANAGFEFRKETAEPFSLTTFQSANQLGNDILTVYIEGDGAPWSSSIP